MADSARPAPLARGVSVVAVSLQAPKFLSVSSVSSVQEWVQDERLTTALPVRYVNDPALESGRQVVVTPAATGETLRTWQIRAVDGREAARTLLVEEIVRAPVAEVRRLGTKPRVVPPAPAEIEKIIRDAAAKWGADPEQLLRVAWCESRFNPNAFNPTANDSGLFQFIPETWWRQSPRAGYAGASPFDPVAAANTAAMLFSQGQARLWTCK